MSQQDQQLATVSSRGADALGTAWSNWAALLDHPHDEVRSAAAVELADLTASLASLLIQWHQAGQWLLPAQSARLAGMDPARRIPAPEVARRLGLTTATAYDSRRS